MSENGMSPADMAAVMGNSNGYHGGNGFGFNDGAWWIIILFLFAMNGGWGNGWGNNGGMNQLPYWMAQQNNGNDIQRGFDQNSVMNTLGNITGSINGLGNSLCNGFAGVNQNISATGAGVVQAVSNGFAQAEISNNARQMADMNQNFGMQTALATQLNNIAMAQQNCCCENRAATADLKYTVANEACADRAAVNNALRDVTAQGVANTQALMNTMNAGIQSIKDQMCNDKIDAKNERIAELERQLTMANLASSQSVQTSVIQSGQRALANEIEQYVNPTPRPAYIVQNPNGCNCQNYNPYMNYGCGCGVGAA